MPPGRKLGSGLFRFDVMPIQPYHVPLFILGRYFVLDPEGLRPGHEFLGGLPRFFELVQAFGHLGHRSLGAVPISMRMISHQKVERRLPCSFTSPIIVRKFRHRQISYPVVLLVVNEELEVCLYPLVVAL